jgi:hypothetical protein
MTRDRRDVQKIHQPLAILLGGEFDRRRRAVKTNVPAISAKSDKEIETRSDEMDIDPRF